MLDLSRARRLLQTSTFRLAFLGALLFAMTGLAMLGVVKWTTGALLEQRMARSIDGELDRLRTVYDQGGIVSLTDEVNGRANSLQGRLRVYLLVDASGRVLAGNLAAWPDGDHLHFDAPEGFYEPGSPVQAVVLPLGTDGKLLVGRLQNDRVAFDKVIDLTMLGGAGLSLLLGLGVGVTMARRALRRIDEINRTVATILGGELRGRVATRGTGDEFDQLAANLNGMFERIERLILAMRAVTRNVAHDLRTPLNRLRNRLELALIEGERAEPSEVVLAGAIGDVDGILATFNALLSIARIEGRAPRENFRDVALDRLAEGLADLYAPFAEDEGLTLEMDIAQGVIVAGNSHLLSQAVANLLDNAIKYTPPGGNIRVTVGGDARAAWLAITDNGPGIPANQRERVLEPFLRLAECRHSPGTGLGLSVVAAIAEAHEAQLLLEDAKPGLKVNLIFTLPEHGDRIKSL
jgi:signal transduction histidine kinase